MRIFRFWSRYTATLHEAGVTQNVACYGGSDESEDAARLDAERRLAAVRARILGQQLSPSEYEADIREELIERLDSHNAVTRNRYGALVLNSDDHLFLDLDEPRYRFWEIFLGLRDPRKRKQRILKDLAKRVEATDCRGLSFRVYETHKGIRVIVTGRRFDPKADGTGKFMRSFNVDFLYATLCRRQACFRARLTPKPYRMRLRALRVVYPRDDARQAEFEAWLPGYQEASRRYSSCHFLHSIGPEIRSSVVDHHDRLTEAFAGKPLA